MCFFPVLVNMCWSHLCVRCVSSGVQNALALGTSVFERMCKYGCGIVCACVCLRCLPVGWAVGGQDGNAVCRLLSSLYSNDRPCCFTCCGERSAVELSPCTSPSLKPEHKCCLLGSHGSVHMCSGSSTGNKHVWEELRELDYWTAKVTIDLCFILFVRARVQYVSIWCVLHVCKYILKGKKIIVWLPC